MKWIVRGFLVVITLVVAVFAGAAVLLMTFNPNDYKPQIASAVTNATGRAFAINGDIKATLFPVLGFEAAGVEMGQPEGFGDAPFLTVGSMTAGVKLQPLLERKIELTKIVLSEPAIAIIKKADGSNNLTFPQRGEAKVAANDDRPAMDLSFGEIEVVKARATYNDRAKNETWTIDPLNVRLPGFRPGSSTNIKIDMTAKRGDDLRVAVDGSAAMNATPADGTFKLDGTQARLRIKSPALADEAVVNLRGDMTLDTKAEKADIKNMRITWDGTNIEGQAAVTNFKKPQIKFTANAPSIDIDTLTKALAPKDPAKKAQADLIPFDVIKNFAMDGKITINTLKIAGLTLTGLEVPVHTQNGRLTLEPVRAKLYEGALDAKIVVDAQARTPTLSAAGKLSALQVGQIMQAKMGQDFLSGLAGFNFDLRGTGRTMDALKSAASGNFGFDFGEGYINKWQLSRRINQAITYFEKGQIDENAPDRIYFTSLKGAFNGQNGVFRNDNLVLLAPKSHALGGGTINLARDQVDYTMRVGLGEDPKTVERPRYLPIKISGPLTKPQYGLDIQSLIGQQVEEKKDELINKAFDRLLGDKGAKAPAEGAAATEGAAEAAPAKADPGEQLLRGILGGIR